MGDSLKLVLNSIGLGALLLSSTASAVIDATQMDQWSVSSGTIGATCESSWTCGDALVDAGFFQRMITDEDPSFFQTIITEDPSNPPLSGESLFSGVLRASGNEAGVSGIIVNIYGQSGGLLASAVTDEFGHYEVNAVFDGSVYIEYALSENYLGYVYGGEWCAPDSVCDVFTGEKVTPVQQSDGTFSFYKNSVLHNGAVIQGKVTASGSGSELSGIKVVVTNDRGDIVWRTYTYNGGGYSAVVPESGNYYVVAYGRYGYAGKVYGGESCMSPCDLPGSAVKTVFRKTTLGIDMALDLAGAIQGHVYYGDSGDVIGEQGVNLHLLNGEIIQRTTTSEDGRFVFENLVEGEYYISSDSSGEYMAQFYEGNSCSDASSCEQGRGSTVNVYQGETTNGVDVFLARGLSVDAEVKPNGGGGITGGLMLVAMLLLGWRRYFALISRWRKC